MAGEILLKSGEVKIRVIYADTDAMGIVYHASYIRWFEAGRTELCRELGVTGKGMELSSCYLPLTKLFCHYLLPARYDDLLIVETTIHDVKRASIEFGYRIFDEKKRRLLVRGSTIHACTNETGNVVRIPKILIDTLQYFKDVEGE